MNKVVKAKHIENIGSWTDAFLNYAKILVENHTTMASELFTYMSIIRGALADATFDRVYMYDQQFRLRKSLNPTRPWSQVDGVLWLRFIAKEYKMLIVTTFLNKENAMILISKEAVFEIIALIYILA